ncbi:MAG: hypothetical protein DBY35_07495 [Bacteroidales bacterium]|nr:MAG: hypothetical protein DBY35_07495 [Bacteroidales bacterium]
MQERPVNLNEPPAGNPVDRLPATINIESLIYVVRDEQVMLDSDLAKLYDVETKVLNQAVKRNIQRFPPDFMFQLTKEECLRSQFVTSNKGRGGARYLPYAFTENGVAMHACNKAHDRFLIIDEEVYHIGHSLKDLGKKLFAFSKMDVMTGSELLSRL